MSQGAIFGFGCIIFFIVLTGTFLYGLMTVRESAEQADVGALEFAGLAARTARPLSGEHGNHLVAAAHWNGDGAY